MASVSEGTTQDSSLHRGNVRAVSRDVLGLPDGDEPAPAAERAFYHLQEVRAFLKVLGIGAEYIREALRELTAGRSAFLTNIALTEKAVKNAGFAASEIWRAAMNLGQSSSLAVKNEGVVHGIQRQSS